MVWFLKALTAKMLSLLDLDKIQKECGFTANHWLLSEKTKTKNESLKNDFAFSLVLMKNLRRKGCSFEAQNQLNVVS